MDQNRERQAAEITLLSTMYPVEFSWRSNPPPDLDNLQFTEDPAFALTLDPNYTLEFTLHSDYPEPEKPNVYLSCGGEVDTSHRKHARAALANLVKEQDHGIEVLDLIVTSFLDLLPELKHHTPHTSSSENGQLSGHNHKVGGNNPQPTSLIKRVVIWSHHLLATSKRRDIQAWSKELQLGGFSRPGYPGSVFAEGDQDQVDEFVRRLKQLRWQALQLRAEDSSNSRVCGPGNGVVEVEGLGDIAERLKKLDPPTANLFLQGMKISKTE